WGSNPDARIIRLEYHGEPVAESVTTAAWNPASDAGASSDESDTSRANSGAGAGDGAPSGASADGGASLAFTWPPEGGFVAYDKPFSYRVDGEAEELQVRVLAGHDTHAHLVQTLS